MTRAKPTTQMIHDLQKALVMIDHIRDYYEQPGLIRSFLQGRKIRAGRREALNPTSTNVTIWVKQFKKKYGFLPLAHDIKRETRFYEFKYFTHEDSVEVMATRHKKVLECLKDYNPEMGYYVDLGGSVWFHDPDEIMMFKLTLDF